MNKLAKIVVWGNSATCSHCQTLFGPAKTKPVKKMGIMRQSVFQQWLTANSATLQIADGGIDAKAYAAARKQYKLFGDFPQIVLCDATGKMIYKKVARVNTTAKLIALIQSACPGCFDGCCNGQSLRAASQSKERKRRCWT